MRIRLIALGLTVLAVTGCSDGGDSMEPTASLAEVQATAQKSVNDAAAAIFPAGFSLENQGPQPLQCTGASGRADGRVLTSVNFWVNGPDRIHDNAYFDALKKWWAAHGWALVKDSRPGDMFINANHDDYLMSLEATKDGRLNIGASTPCVWKTGTPESTP